jgi:hypothetical protein
MDVLIKHKVGENYKCIAHCDWEEKNKGTKVVSAPLVNNFTSSHICKITTEKNDYSISYNTFPYFGKFNGFIQIENYYMCHVIDSSDIIYTKKGDLHKYNYLWTFEPVTTSSQTYTPTHKDYYTVSDIEYNIMSYHNKYNVSLGEGVANNPELNTLVLSEKKPIYFQILNLKKKNN